jgi:flagellar protein FlbT
MIIHLKKNEKLFINGAVIMLDRRGSIELLNDAQFLLASHVLQVEEASTPLRRLYFVIQTMIIDPANAELTKALFTAHLNQLKSVISDAVYGTHLALVENFVNDAEYFEALKLLRRNFALDDKLRSAGEKVASGENNARAA